MAAVEQDAAGKGEFLARSVGVVGQRRQHLLLGEFDELILGGLHGGRHGLYLHGEGRWIADRRGHRQDTSAILMTQSVICKRCVIASASHLRLRGGGMAGLSEVVQATIGRPALVTGLARALQGAPNSIVQYTPLSLREFSAKAAPTWVNIGFIRLAQCPGLASQPAIALLGDPWPAAMFSPICRPR